MTLLGIATWTLGAVAAVCVFLFLIALAIDIFCRVPEDSEAEDPHSFDGGD